MAWKAAVQRVTVNGVEYSKTDYITFDSNQTLQLPLADNEIGIEAGSFQSRHDLSCGGRGRGL